MTPELTMYTTVWCGYCSRLKRHLDREGVRYAEVNIEHDPAAADLVRSLNDGNSTRADGGVRRRQRVDEPQPATGD